jgi:hypothetical protein
MTLRPTGASLVLERLSMVATVVCAVECALLPIASAALPLLGHGEEHLDLHGVLALFVVPLVLVMLALAYRRHRRRRLLALGMVGVALVGAGALPGLHHLGMLAEIGIGLAGAAAILGAQIAGHRAGACCAHGHASHR